MTTVVIPLTSAWSDGDSTKWPVTGAGGDGFQVWLPDLYLKTLAQTWMRDRGEAEEGKEYVLESLPVGYQVFGKPRDRASNVGSGRVDKYLHGHPSGRSFNAPTQFYLHFLHLMSSGTQPCACRICALGQSRRTTNQARSAATEEPSNLHRTLGELEQADYISQDIMEPQSPTWQANRQSLRTELAKSVNQPSFVPRKGEIVLFYVLGPPNCEVTADRRGPTHTFRFFDVVARQYLGYPDWEAGIVVHVPNRDYTVHDLFNMQTPNEEQFKVVPYLGPNGDPDRLLPDETVNVSLHQIRPFTFTTELMTNIAVGDYDPSIWLALDVLSSFALVDKNRVEGHWPTASVYCGAAWVGAELLVLGDAVRFWGHDGQVKMLVVEKIELKLTDLVAGLEGTPSEIWFSGRAYSQHPTSFSPEAVSAEENMTTMPKGSQKYTWYPMHDTNVLYRANVNNVIGRCYEADAVILWLAALPDVVYGAATVAQAREDRASNDTRKPEGQQWFFADDRLQQLNVTATKLFGMEEPNPRSASGLWEQFVASSSAEGTSVPIQANTAQMTVGESSNSTNVQVVIN
ncbi:MAG: hypothetical protein M1816_006649 [Peltula sp. TS41687]|nr:MAG: hypothetical protein M1816_006649 [Peltula sp. TS41687]